MTTDVTSTIFSSVPDKEGHYGLYGGKFVAETLMSALAELEVLYRQLADDEAFQRELDHDLAHFVGRPSPLYEAKRWSDRIGGARIYLKREDLNHTGAHKMCKVVVQLALEGRVIRQLAVYNLKLGERRHQCFGNKLAPVKAEVSLFIRN